LEGKGASRTSAFVRLEVLVRVCRGFRGRESAIETEASAKDRGVEKGQGELIVVHGEALMKSAGERDPQRMNAASCRLDAKAERERFRTTRG
jgi:hypothetical protein